MGKRKRKGAIVEKVENKATGRTGAVRLEKSTMYFFAMARQRSREW